MLSSSRLISRRIPNRCGLHISSKRESAFQRSRIVVRQEKDPHQLASDMVRDAPDARSFNGDRISGTEALQSITPEQKMKNYVMAIGLVGFCTGVWYYSIQSVGKADGGFDALQAEAQEARIIKVKKDAETIDVQDLTQLDETIQSLDENELEQIASLDDMTHNTSGGKGPFWKRVVFFWKKQQ